MNVVESVKNLFRYHKVKIGFFFASLLVFLLLLFPTNDLSELLINTVSESTNKNVILDFSELGFTIFPTPGVDLRQVTIESAFAPTISFDSLTISPSIRSLFSFKPGFSANIENLFAGDVSLSIREGSETQKGASQVIADVDLSKISLEKILSFIDAPISLHGTIQGEFQGTIDPSFKDQPESEIEINIKDFKLPKTNFPIPNFGSFPLPEIKISQIKLKGKMTKQGDLYVQRLELGSNKDQLNGTVKGEMRLRFVSNGAAVEAVPGRFNFDLNLKVLPQLQKELQLVLGLVDAYKTPGIGYDSYCIKLSGQNFYGVPSMTKQDTCN